MADRRRIDLINELTRDLPPVNPRHGVVLPAMIWVVASWLYVIVLGLYLGALREGALDALIASPRFAIESFIGLVCGVLFGVLAFQESIPGIQRKWLVSIGVISVFLWIACYVADLSFPALEPSMVGKRAHCVLEAYLYSVPPFIIGYFLIYRRYPLDFVRAALFLSLSAGIIPALFMQFACMYVPLHTLTHHLGPILIIMFCGMLLGAISYKTPSLQH